PSTSNRSRSSTAWCRATCSAPSGASTSARSSTPPDEQTSRRLLAVETFQVVEQAGDRLGGLVAPRGDDVVGLRVLELLGQALEERREHRPLLSHQRPERLTRPLAEQNLGQQGAADVAQVPDGLTAPLGHGLAALPGRLVDHPARPGSSPASTIRPCSSSRPSAR